MTTAETLRPLKPRSIERRTREERRQSSVGRRLRVGLWYQYHRVTRAGEFDPLPRDPRKRLQLEEALLPEMLKYEFCDLRSRSQLSPSRALANALDHLWANPNLGCNLAGESAAAYAIGAIADYLNRSYQVAGIDRRKADRRAKPSGAS